MKKKLILALVIAIGVVIVFAYGLKKWQNQKEANLVEMLTAENQLVYGNEIVELEKGEEIRSDVWNEFTETARMKGEKEENSEKRVILMHDIKIGMSYEEVKEKLDIRAGYAQVNLEDAGSGDGCTQIYDFVSEGDEFWQKYKILDAQIHLVYEKTKSGYELMTIKDAEEKKCEKVHYYIDFLGDELAEQEGYPAKSVMRVWVKAE